MRARSFLLFVLVTLVTPASRKAAARDSWPMFRGPNASGHGAANTPLPVQFGPGQSERWSTILPPGHSSPCVWDHLIFLTGAEKDSTKLETIALRRSDGSIFWRRSVEAAQLERLHKVNNPASATCVTDGWKVISYFGSFGLVCYDFSGRELWRYPMPVYDCQNGSGTSPLLVNDTVYLNREDQVDQALIALDADTGTEKWKRKHPNSQPNGVGVASTPIVWNNQIILHRAGSIAAHNPADGEVLWFIPANTTGCSTPVVAEGKLIACTWTHAGEADQAPPWPEWATLVQKFDKNHDGKISEDEFPDDFAILIRPEIDPSLGGNISFKLAMFFFDENHDKAIDEAEWKSALVKSVDYLKSQKHGIIAVDLTHAGTPTAQNILWKVERNVPEVPSPLVHKSRVYLVRNGGLLLCLDLATGQILYQERLGAPGPYFASPVEAADRIYVAAGSGKVAVLQDGPSFQLLAANDLGEEIFASPAIAGEDLLIRTTKHLFAFRAKH